MVFLKSIIISMKRLEYFESLFLNITFFLTQIQLFFKNMGIEAKGNHNCCQRQEFF